MADLTNVPSLFGLVRFRLAVVFDAFSRMPLAAKVFEKGPTALHIARLLSATAQTFGAPGHFICDHERCFSGRQVGRALARLGARRRFGAVGKSNSIALIERLWRALKEKLALKAFKPLLLDDARRRLELGLIHHAFFRPHSSLGGATPAEIYFGRTPVHLSAMPPPRGGKGQVVKAPQFEIVFLDPERRLPVLVKNAA